MTPKRKTKALKLIDALNTNKMHQYLDTASEIELSEIKHSMTQLIYWWLGDPTIERVRGIFLSFPFLSNFLNIKVIEKRFDHIHKFDRNSLGISISKFIPELVKIRNEATKKFLAIPKGINKAELWLYPIAKDAGADADLEAAIYFASRKKLDIVDPEQLKNKWHKSICYDIERGAPIANRLSEDVIKRAKLQLISLSEAAELLAFNDSLNTFFSFRDEEQDFIDPCFFRAVEWFGIKGFDPWINSMANDFTTVTQYGVDHVNTSWQLFFWCRSDLALRKINHFGLESILYALMNGNHERSSPWKQTSWTAKDYTIVDYIPTASILVFAWHRVRPANLDSSIVERAINLVFSSQMPSGAWLNKSDDIEESIMSTCFAIHALATAKPSGWLNACKIARDWLFKQQDENGCWSVERGPIVMITVLVLDSISLVEENPNLTFNSKNISQIVQSDERQDIADPVYDFSNESWYNKRIPSFISASKTEISKHYNPKIALVVATSVELEQVLLRFQPLKGKRKISKVTFKHETYYLGRFGCFDSVLVMTSMGTEGITGSALTINSLIQTWDPSVILLLGIAFGVDRKKHLPADILIAEHIIPYENQRIGDKIIFRNPIPPSSSILLNRFKNSLDWNFERPDKTKVAMHFGPVLSGSKLVDNLKFKNQLLEEYPNAIGGEMEGSGLFSASERNKKEWILIKAVCDWGDGKKNKQFQQMAAASAVSLCKHVLSDPNVLDGVQ